MGFHSLRPVPSLSRPYPGPIPWDISRPACRSTKIYKPIGTPVITLDNKKIYRYVITYYKYLYRSDIGYIFKREPYIAGSSDRRLRLGIIVKTKRYKYAIRNEIKINQRIAEISFYARAPSVNYVSIFNRLKTAAIIFSGVRSLFTI